MPALTPIELPPDALLALHAAHPNRYPVLLQSVSPESAHGAFDILLAHPGAHLTLHASGQLTTSAPIALKETFLASLDEWWRAEYAASKRSDTPFSGGWFLFLGYELAREIEPTLRLPSEDIVAYALRIPAAIILRHNDGATWIVHEQPSQLTQIESDVRSLSPPAPAQECILANGLNEDPESAYLAGVRTALEHIAAGDMYQANLSRRWSGTLAPNVEPHHVYRRLRRANPAPFAALALVGNRAIVSSSPERLVAVRDRIVATRPIAGTRPRRTDRSDDGVRLQELHSHPKERAEHVMLIDLERNDLGRICEAGSVVVDEFMTLESYEHVHHIVSNIRGTLRTGITPGEVIAAVFPGGTITGCPKIRCMQIIAELEGTARGAYTGSIGYLNRDGSLDLNILIRTLEMRDGELSFRAGAGIVADSNPERELEETRAKARGLIRAVENRC